MIKTRISYLASLGFAALALTVIPAAKTNAPVTPTFSRDVAPIVFKNCASCHRPGDIAPMSLLTYEAVRPWAKKRSESR